MLNIAICDDDANICGNIENRVRSLFKESEKECEFDTFTSGRSLCNEMAKTKYDILFLDIEIPDMGGIEIGRYIREELKDYNIQIAYISSKTQYAMELFDYRPINFIIKPIEKEVLNEKVIQKYLAIERNKQYCFTYKKRFEHFRIPMSDIICFKQDKRKIHIITRNRIDEFYGSMEQIYSEVKNFNFLFIHKSAIINYTFISKINYNEVEMMDGEIFSISQSRRSAIRSQYLRISESEGW